MLEDERDYFERRAEKELELAHAAPHANAVRAHYTMAGHYLDRVHGPAEAELPAHGAKLQDGGVSRGFDEWALRFANKAVADHGELASHYVATRVEAARTASDARSAQLWEAVLQLLERPSPGPAAEGG